MSYFTNRVIALMAVGIAINVLVGTIVNLTKLPIYLDAIGTVLVTIVVGFRAGAIAGVASFLIGGFLFNPALPWFVGTQVVIALATAVLFRFKMFENWVKVTFSGLIIGVVSAVVSAPVIAYLFGGITGSGPSLVVAYLLSTGETLLNSVILSGFTSEPIDKTLQCLIAFWLYRQIPENLIYEIKKVS